MVLALVLLPALAGLLAGGAGEAAGEAAPGTGDVVLAIFVTLGRLEEKGLISAWSGDAAAEPGHLQAHPRRAS